MRWKLATFRSHTKTILTSHHSENLRRLNSDFAHIKNTLQFFCHWRISAFFVWVIDPKHAASTQPYLIILNHSLNYLPMDLPLFLHYAGADGFGNAWHFGSMGANWSESDNVVDFIAWHWHWKRKSLWKSLRIIV